MVGLFSADQLISAVETGSITGVNMTKELIEALKSFKCEHCVCFGIFVLLDLRAVFETRRHKTVLLRYFCCVCICYQRRRLLLKAATTARKNATREYLSSCVFRWCPFGNHNSLFEQQQQQQQQQQSITSLLLCVSITKTRYKGRRKGLE